MQSPPPLVQSGSTPRGSCHTRTISICPRAARAKGAGLRPSLRPSQHCPQEPPPGASLAGHLSAPAIFYLDPLGKSTCPSCDCETSLLMLPTPGHPLVVPGPLSPSTPSPSRQSPSSLTHAQAALTHAPPAPLTDGALTPGHQAKPTNAYCSWGPDRQLQALLDSSFPKPGPKDTWLLWGWHSQHVQKRPRICS